MYKRWLWLELFCLYAHVAEVRTAPRPEQFYDWLEPILCL